MFGSVILDVAIGMALIYFLFSLIASSVAESISDKMALRARTLRKGIENLLQIGNDGKDDQYKNLLNDLYKHPLIYALYKEDDAEKATPSYIPAQTFAIALLDTLHKINNTGNDIAQLRQALDSQRNTSPIAQGVLSIIDQAQGDPANTQKGIEGWFNASMQRVSGWYKKGIHNYVMAVSVVIVIVFNVDTLYIANTLYYDQTLRSSMVAAADNVGQSYNASASATESVKKIQQQTGKANIHIGWPEPQKGQSFITYLGSILPTIPAKIPGWIITFFAISLGAPFWFDILNKLVNIRQAGGKPSSDKDSQTNSSNTTSAPPAAPQPAAITPARQANPFVSGDYKHE